MKDSVGIKVIKILDGKTSYLKLKNYIMFENNWISKHDKILYNNNGDTFFVLDFQEIEQEMPILPIIPTSIPIKKTFKKKFSCLKLNKNIDVGDVLYI